jgi:hypothetical protein
MIELRQARDTGVKITARCAWGHREGLKSIRRCTASVRLDLDSLVWTRGAEFPVSMLAERLKCPRCGSRKMAHLFDMPAQQNAQSDWRNTAC